MIDFRETARDIHASNVAAGWWPADPSQRNRGEVMMLIVSEVAEAAEGLVGNLNDDKLPHLKMFDVELADTAIRLFDLIGADAIEQQHDMAYLMDLTFEEIHGNNAELDLMLIVRCVANGMEHHRKGRRDEYGEALWRSLAAVYALADAYGVALDQVIAEKRAFNAVREDHKIENRLKPGGKAY